MKTKLLTALLCLLPLLVYSQNYEKEGDDLFAQAQYEQAEKKYKAAIAILGESQTIKQKQDKCTKCKSLLAKAQTSEKESRYSDAVKYYSDLYAFHALPKYQSKVNVMKQKIQERLEKEEAERRAEQERQAEQERLAKERAEKERLAREQAEKERLARERAEKERLARERAEKERIARELAEKERRAKIEAERRAEQEQLAKERAEQKRALYDGRPVKGKCGENLTWEYYNGTLTISGKGEMEDFRYPKKSPWEELYIDRKMKSIIINNGVTSIGNSAFEQCTSLTSVTIPNSVTSIGDHAFDYCIKLTSVTIPNSVTSIGDYAFQICSSLTSVTILNSVTRIGEGAFSGCSKLSSIIIPNSVTNISRFAFTGCSNLHIKLPERFRGKVSVSSCKSVTYY